MSVKVPFTGGCICGAVRYECTAEPVMTFKCHCRDCQHVTGGAYVPGLLVPAPAFDCENNVIVIETAKLVQRDGFNSRLNEMVQRRRCRSLDMFRPLHDPFQHLLGAEDRLMKVYLPIHEPPGH